MHEYQKIAVLENEIEASFLEAVLKERAIPCSIRSFHDAAYDGLFQLHKGWGAVYGPVEFKDEILEILKEIRTDAQPQ